jgi:rhodanese-related sulfurtransferase
VRVSLVRQIAFLLALAFVPAIGQALWYRGRVSWQTPVRSANQVSVAEAESWKAGALWIDARPDAQFAQAHIPNALPLNEDRWNELLPAVLSAWSPEKKIVVYCSSQSCGSSREVARRLREEDGLRNVFVLEGGWEEWRKAHK